MFSVYCISLRDLIILDTLLIVSIKNKGSVSFRGKVYDKCEINVELNLPKSKKRITTKNIFHEYVCNPTLLHILSHKIIQRTGRRPEEQNRSRIIDGNNQLISINSKKYELYVMIALYKLVALMILLMYC